MINTPPGWTTDEWSDYIDYHGSKQAPNSILTDERNPRVLGTPTTKENHIDHQQPEARERAHDGVHAVG